jgi:DHA1 family bicyclomycin/chloramphenicol resistance-like MFS transporter
VFIERYGIEPRTYGLIFGAQVMFLTVASLTNARFVPRWAPSACCAPPSSCRRSPDHGAGDGSRRGTHRRDRPVAVPAPVRAADRLNSFIGANAIAMALQRYPHMAALPRR